MHWEIYRGTGVPHDDIDRLPAPPPWRDFGVREPALSADPPAESLRATRRRAASYRATQEAVRAVNAAMYLRRPLLVTGPPGVGKSTLAYSVAHELRLGDVLWWPITTRSTLRDGLYLYDAIGRLQESTLAGRADAQPDIGNFLQLGPLGTAMLPWYRPRVLLIDELDKSDLDLPNDLLNIFEEGRFGIPELARLPFSEVDVRTADGDRVRISNGVVQCGRFPLIFITSNGERAFPPAFQRRCILHDVPAPSADALAEIVTSHLGPDAREVAQEMIVEFLNRREYGHIATDQLLNAVYLTLVTQTDLDREGLARSLLRTLDSA